MDQDTVRKLADILAEKISSSEWSHIIWLMLLTLIAAAAGSFFGSYFKMKGEHFATKEDFDTLSEQLRHNTALVEAVKSEVGYRDWRKREWINLQRIKLEELMQKLHESERLLDVVQHHAIAGKLTTESSTHPFGEMESIATLYCPEIEPDVMVYSSLCKRDFIAALELCVQVQSFSQTGNHSGVAVTIAQYQERSGALYPERLAAISNLKKSVRKHLESILLSDTRD
jgi:hypothetical protein